MRLPGWLRTFQASASHQVNTAATRGAAPLPPAVEPPAEPIDLPAQSSLSHPLGRGVLAAMIGLQLVIGSCVSLGPMVGIEAIPNLSAITDVQEDVVLRTTDAPGQLIQVVKGRNTLPPTITIHGINGGPESIAPLTQEGIQRGGSVYTFLYNDQYRRAAESGSELAQQLFELQFEQPGVGLRIDAHSYGALIALSALEDLSERGSLTAPVELRLVAPYFVELSLAEHADVLPDFLAYLIPGVRPGIDVGLNSDFQQRLEKLKLPANVHITIYIGDQDPLVDHRDAHFLRVAESLGAKVVVVPGGNHIDTAALVRDTATEKAVAP